VVELWRSTWHRWNPQPHGWRYLTPARRLATRWGRRRVNGRRPRRGNPPVPAAAWHAYPPPLELVTLSLYRARWRRCTYAVPRLRDLGRSLHFGPTRRHAITRPRRVGFNLLENEHGRRLH